MLLLFLVLAGFGDGVNGNEGRPDEAELLLWVVRGRFAANGLSLSKWLLGLKGEAAGLVVPFRGDSVHAQGLQIDCVTSRARWHLRLNRDSGIRSHSFLLLGAREEHSGAAKLGMPEERSQRESEGTRHLSLKR
jgi:hypothetical protein